MKQVVIKAPLNERLLQILKKISPQKKDKESNAVDQLQTLKIFSVRLGLYAAAEAIDQLLHFANETKK